MPSAQEKKEFSQYLVDTASDNVFGAVSKGLSFYLSFMVLDYIGSPKTYPILWGIRFFVAMICISILSMRELPFIREHRRVVFLFCLSLVINSIPFIWHFRNPEAPSMDLSIVSLALVMSMAAFRVLASDALIIGAIYCATFFSILIYRDTPQEFWLRYSISIAVAYGMGAICAFIAESYLFKAFQGEKLARLQAEKADNLLTKTFPLEIANDLKVKKNSKASRFDNVTVMFCDIVNFTEVSASMPPEELVSWLNQFFSILDRLTYQYGCEKIKTIGDAYMAVAGVPKRAADHAERMINLALSIQVASKNLLFDGKPLKLRIGVSSGPVVAGVIGEIRFAYDVWGDTVNTASRLEALCRPGKILMTESTKVGLGSKFRFEKIASGMIKGKGEIEVWELVDPAEYSLQSAVRESA